MFKRRKAAAKREQRGFEKRQEESQKRLGMMQSMAGPSWDEPSVLESVDEGPLDAYDVEWWKASVDAYEDPMEEWIHDKRKSERTSELKALGGGSVGDGRGKIRSRGSEGEGRDVRDMIDDPRFSMLHSGSKAGRKKVGEASGHDALTPSKSIAQKIPLARTLASLGGIRGQHVRAKENDAILGEAEDRSEHVNLAESLSEGFAADRRRDRNVGVPKALYNGGKDALLVGSLGGTDLLSEGLDAVSSGVKGLMGAADKVHPLVSTVDQSIVGEGARWMKGAREALPGEASTLADTDKLVNRGVRAGVGRAQDDVALEVGGRGLGRLSSDETFSEDDKEVLSEARDVDEDEEEETDDELLGLGRRLFSETDRADEQNQGLIEAFGVHGKRRRLRKDKSRGLRETMLNYLDHGELGNNEGSGGLGSVLKGARSLQGDGRSRREKRADKKGSKQSNKAGNEQREELAVREALQAKQESDPEAKLGWKERRQAKKGAGTAEGSSVQEHTLRPSQVARLDRGEQARLRQQERMGGSEESDEDNLLERLQRANKKRWYE